MALAEAARPLLLPGRFIAFAGAVLAVGLMAWQAYELLRHAFLSEHPTWGEVGLYPFVTG